MSLPGASFAADAEEPLQISTGFARPGAALLVYFSGGETWLSESEVAAAFESALRSQSSIRSTLPSDDWRACLDRPSVFDECVLERVFNWDRRPVFAVMLVITSDGQGVELTPSIYMPPSELRRSAAGDEKPVIRLEREAVEDLGEVREYINRILDGPPLEQTIAEYPPWGRLEVHSTVLGGSLSLNGERMVADARARVIEIHEVPPGKYEVVLNRLDFVEPATASVHLPPSEHRVVQLRPRVSLGTAGRVSRGALLWGGGALVAAGVALVVFDRVQASRSRTLCISADCPPAFTGFGGSSSGTFADPSMAETGFPILPVAVGLIGAGSSFAVGTLTTDETEIPWTGLVVGAAAGVLGVVVGLVSMTAQSFSSR